MGLIHVLHASSLVALLHRRLGHIESRCRLLLFWRSRSSSRSCRPSVSYEHQCRGLARKQVTRLLLSPGRPLDVVPITFLRKNRAQSVSTEWLSPSSLTGAPFYARGRRPFPFVA